MARSIGNYCETKQSEQREPDKDEVQQQPVSIVDRRSSIATALVAIGFVGVASHQAGIDSLSGLLRPAVATVEQTPQSTALPGDAVPGVDELIAGLTVVDQLPTIEASTWLNDTSLERDPLATSKLDIVRLWKSGRDDPRDI
ncbi:hypothetical protein [Rhodococcus jostii]|uniref:hypothetical protein n=1 Tax=Rhodococcus jostii TaxID=132919 RepID=UPI00366496EC